MKLEKKDLNLKDGIKKEWVITNGLGGFCSSSVLGANTRRYHGLLVAPLLPPAKRYLLISKIDESLRVGDKTYNLFTNICENYVSDGFKYLKSFEKKYVPEFIFDVEGIKISKKISMIYGRNIVCVTYEIENLKEDSTLVLTPIISFRDFHGLNTNHTYSLKQKIDKSKVRVEVDGNADTPIYMYISNANYIEHFNDTFTNIYYLKEDERGFYPEENLLVPGRYEVNLKAGEVNKITFVGSLEENIEEIDGFKVIDKEKERLDKIIYNANLEVHPEKLQKKHKDFNEYMDELVIATDNFVIYRPSFRLHSMLAGIPWFLDWGRDSMIAYEGIFLITKRFDLAREILRTFTRDIKFGLVPNGYSGFDNRPLYNSVDSSLLLFEQINKFLRYTNDYDFIKENLYESLKSIITNYEKGINLDDNNIYVDKDLLVVSGTPNTQNTWMDVKIGDFVVTPRNGKVVEINALWYNALKTLECLAQKFGDEALENECRKKALAHKKAFNKVFYNEKKKSLYDVLGDDKIRPNQLFAFSTTYPVWDFKNENTMKILETIEDKLLLKYGLRTLSKSEKEYIPVYEGDPNNRDKSYHQGIPWPWTLGLYFDALKNLIANCKDKKTKQILEDKYNKFINTTYNTFIKEINKEDCIGNISEVYDAKLPYKPGGAPAQAWSVAEVLRISNEYKKNCY